MGSSPSHIMTLPCYLSWWTLADRSSQFVHAFPMLARRARRLSAGLVLNYRRFRYNPAGSNNGRRQRNYMAMTIELEEGKKAAAYAAVDELVEVNKINSIFDVMVDMVFVARAWCQTARGTWRQD